MDGNGTEKPARRQDLFLMPGNDSKSRLLLRAGVCLDRFRLRERAYRACLTRLCWPGLRSGPSERNGRCSKLIDTLPIPNERTNGLIGRHTDRGQCWTK